MLLQLRRPPASVEAAADALHRFLRGGGDAAVAADRAAEQTVAHQGV